MLLFRMMLQIDSILRNANRGTKTKHLKKNQRDLLAFFYARVLLLCKQAKQYEKVSVPPSPFPSPRFALPLPSPFSPFVFLYWFLHIRQIFVYTYTNVGVCVGLGIIMNSWGLFLSTVFSTKKRIWKFTQFQRSFCPGRITLSWIRCCAGSGENKN